MANYLDDRIKNASLAERHDRLRRAVLDAAARFETLATHDEHEAKFDAATRKVRLANADYLRKEAGALRELAEEIE
jgi:hypothetical protein